MKKAAQILLGTLLIALGARIPFAALMAVLILPQQFTSIARVIPPQSAFTTVAREIEIIQSARVLDPVVTYLDLCTRFNKVFHSDEPLPPEVCALLLKRDLSVREQKESHLIEIKVVSEDKGQAADIANEIAKVYCSLSQPIVGGTPGGASVLEAAVPAFQGSLPDRLKSIGLSLAVGLIVVSVGAWLLVRAIRNGKAPPTLPQRSE